jgi:hypothetical protein
MYIGMVLTTVSSGSSLNVTWAINSANIAATQGIIISYNIFTVPKIVDDGILMITDPYIK